jgi:nicotinamide mononucleotide transporter
MTFLYWINLLMQQLAHTSWIEWLAVGFGVAEVLLARANKVALYPAGIAATLLSTYLFFISGLYAESLLNLYYIIMSIYGWWYWIKKKNKPPVPITFTNKKEWYTVLLIVAGGLYGFIHHPEKFHPFNGPFFGCLRERYSLGRYVAARQTQSRKLAPAEYFQCGSHSLVIL